MWHGVVVTSRSRARLTPDLIVSAALDLTREVGIDGWTVRDLAARLDTWPNNLAHHVGTREQLCSAVVDRIIASMENPPEDLPWQDWFRRFLTGARDVLLEHRGVARRLCRDGPGVPAAMPIMGRGVARLIDGGFGGQAPFAYSMLLNGGLMLVALADDRVEAGRERADVAASMRAVAPDPDSAPAWQLMHGYFDRWVELGDRALPEMFDITIETVIAGLERRLEQSSS